MFSEWQTVSGPLSEDERDRIYELGEAGLRAYSIGRLIGRHPSSVAWVLTKFGFKRLGPRKPLFLRKGRPVVPFSDEEDAFMIRRSKEGAIPAVIVTEMASQFQYPRTRDTVACRLMMLASDEAAREAA